MSSLFLELILYPLFLYFYLTTFFAEFFNGFMQSFMCVFGWISVKDIDIWSIGLQPFYYTYVIIISLMGNAVFFISFFIYGPFCRVIKTKAKPPKPQYGAVSTSSVGVGQPPHAYNSGRKVMYIWRRPTAHICIFTRYDLYAFLVLAFICGQLVLQGMAGIDDFKAIEGMVFRKTINKNETNKTGDCLADLCDDLTGQQALEAIHLFQQRRHCCGWSGAEDWLTSATDILQTNHSSPQLSYHQNGSSLPQSCCRLQTNSCSLENIDRFSMGCRRYELPVRSVIDPTRYDNRCFGLYPLFKAMAFLTYRYSFAKLFDGTALILVADLSIPSTLRFI